MNLLTSMHGGAMPKQSGSADNFLMDCVVHLRYSRFGDDKLYHVKSLSVSNGVLMIQWTNQAKEQGLPPVATQEVDIYAVRKGVLYMNKGRVLELTSGSLPRIRIKIDCQATKVNLRKHQRFVVRGTLNMGPAGCQFTYMQQTDHEMDISEGGIGLNLPKNALKDPERREESKPSVEVASAAATAASPVAMHDTKVTYDPQDGAEVDPTLTANPIILTPTTEEAAARKVRLELTVYAEKSGRIDNEQPSLNLSCHAEIRRQTPVEGTKDEFVGMQFIDMSVEQQETLRLWLATHSVKLRNR